MRGIERSDDAVTITANLWADLRDTWSAKAPQTASSSLLCQGDFQLKPSSILL